jgi:hypothetical protein
VRDALGSLPPLLVERLLGALELTVAELTFDHLPDLTELLAAPAVHHFGMVTMGAQSEAVTGAHTLDQIRPGAVPLVADVARRLAVHPPVAGLLAVDPAVTDEDGIAAAHAAAHLALAVTTASAVLSRVGVHPWARTPPAIVGVGVGTAVLLLRAVPMPAGYTAAQLARARAEYVLPRQSSGSATVVGHRFALLEDGHVGAGDPEVDFSGNGLVAAVPGGAVIRTGVDSGEVRIVLGVEESEPPPEEFTQIWDEIVDISWRAEVGGASVGDGPHLRRATPPWPGDYRLRVRARGRDETQDRGAEWYELTVWKAPWAPEVVHLRTDRLGHRLRGEPEPVPPKRPEDAFRWLRNSAIEVAATVTVVTGCGVQDVVRAFGGDPARPASILASESDAWVAVLDVGDAVVAIEDNNFQGSTAPVLSRASATGRAASMFWNVNAVTRLSFAERGEVLFSQEPFEEIVDPPAPLADVLEGLDFSNARRGKRAMGLVAVQRFTGYGVTGDDLARILDADVCYRLPE